MFPKYIKMLATQFWHETENWDTKERLEKLRELQVTPLNRKLDGEELVSLTEVTKSDFPHYKDHITVVVPIPKSLLGTTPLLSNVKKPLARLGMSTTDNKDIFLHGFYVYPNAKDSGATDEERRVFRGLGKKLLCHAIFKLHQHGLTSLDKNRIHLEASGGVCDQMIAENDVKIIMQKYPKSFEEVLDELDTATDEEKSEEMHNLACAIIDNFKLVKYYSETYGFKIDSDENPMGVKMSANLSNVIKACV